MGSYLQSLTERNYYRPQETPEINEAVAEHDLPGTPGYSEAIEATTFFRDVASQAVSYFQTLSDGSTPDAIGGGSLGNIDDLIDKTSQEDGHALLAQVVGDTWTEAFASGENTGDPGAALRDMINIFNRRSTYANLVLYPATVQGVSAAQDIVNGIKSKIICRWCG